MNRYAVFGNPINHSLSPKIHKEFANSFNREIQYESVLVPVGKFKEEADKFCDLGGKGLNVTLPFKPDAYDYIDEADKFAELTGAVNTIRFIDGKKIGYNTDGIGFERDVKNNLKYSLENQNILLLGAGGAARGIIPNILNSSPNLVSVYNRTYEKAEILADCFSILGDISAVDESSLCNNQYNMIINATSIGSSKNKMIEIPQVIFDENTICYDLSYGKLADSFKDWARKNNLSFFDGLGMLIEQAAESYFIWENDRPINNEKIKSMLLKDL